MGVVGVVVEPSDGARKTYGGIDGFGISDVPENTAHTTRVVPTMSEGLPRFIRELAVLDCFEGHATDYLRLRRRLAASMRAGTLESFGPACTSHSRWPIDPEK